MSAVWRVARAAVRRRKLQTFVIAVVVALSAMLSVVALGLLVAASGPFDQAYARLRGAHLVASFDAGQVTAERLTAAARASSVAGPFAQAVIRTEGLPPQGPPPQELTVVGRPDPSGPVDRLNVWKGRWATAPGEIVLAGNPIDPAMTRVGDTLPLRGGGSLTVVGFAYSVSGSADAWVTPAQMATMHPTGLQMLYRFAHAATSAEMTANQAAVTDGLPVVAARSYLTLKATAAAQPGTFVPFLIVFGLLGLAVAVLIVANVVSGAVVAGFRHIGMLKALGFTPGQVLAAYLVMVVVPAVAGCVAGVALGTVLANALMTQAFKYWGTGDITVTWWVPALVLVGLPLAVALSALVPALRARALPAARAISAGSTQSRGRAPRIQRRLAGTRLPRAVSLGLGLPFARPGRSAMTMAAIILGVTSVTFAIGLATSMTGYARTDPDLPVQVFAHTAGPADAEPLLRAQPGTKQVTASTDLSMVQAGVSEEIRVRFWRGDAARDRYHVVRGHWFDGAGQIGVSRRFLAERGLALGDELTLVADGRSARVRIVAELQVGSSKTIYSNWPTLGLVAPGTLPDSYEVELTKGTDVPGYIAALTTADESLQAFPADGDADTFLVIMITTVTLLTLMLGAVAALGVFNTVVLDSRERRRDLGMLKSIGMTPGQVVTMMVTSMAGLGALSGLIGIPLGILAHALVLPAMARSAQVHFPAAVLHVYHGPLVALLALAGIAIAALGALLPARSAARTTIASVLHNE